MISKLAYKITEYIKQNSDIFDCNDIERINYSLQVILDESFKLITLTTVFLCLGKLNYFLSSLLIFLSIRIFAGGYHAKTTLSCLISSILIFLITSYFCILLPKFYIAVYFLISFISLLIAIIYALFPNIY